MNNYKAKQLNGMSLESLTSLLQDLQGKLVALRYQAAQGELKQVHQIKEIKKSIARILTIINEKKVSETLTKAENKA